MFGFLGKLFSPVVNVVKSIFGGVKDTAASTVGSTVGSAVGTSIGNKVTGVPTPEMPSQPSGAQQGQSSLDYYNTAFPGTTPWERLGASSPMGQIASTVLGNHTQESMQAKELANRMTIAQQNNRVTAMGYGSPFGVKGAKAMLDIYDHSKPGSYDTPSTMEKEMLPQKKEKEGSSTVFQGLKRSTEEVAGNTAKAIEAVRGLPTSVIRLVDRSRVLRQLESKLKDAQRKYGTVEQQRQRRNNKEEIYAKP